MSIARFIAAARAWRDYQHLDSILDQKSDVRLRVAAEVARQTLLTQIDSLENEPPVVPRLLDMAQDLYAALKAIADRIDAHNGVVAFSPREHDRLAELLDRAFEPGPMVDKCPNCLSVRGYCSCELAYNN